MRKAILAILLGTALMAGGCGEDKPEKDTWYWGHDCWQDYLPYRSWAEGGTYRYEIMNNIKDDDILLTYIMVQQSGKRTEMQALIESGKTTGTIDSGVSDSDAVTIEMVSVISMKGGVPDHPIECQLVRE